MGISGGRRQITLTIALALTTSATTIALAATAQAISRESATAITAGPDGRMWFTLGNANEIGAITTG